MADSTGNEFTKKQPPVLYLVIPCYNEEAVIAETYKRLKQKMESLIAAGEIEAKSKITFVDDGSKDKTWELIAGYHAADPMVSGIRLSRNKGHQNALIAGLMTVKAYCDAAISLDADLQDDINAIDGFVSKYKAGCDVVYGVRNNRKSDTWFKRSTAQGFYKVMKLLGVNMVYNHADYRLMSRRALDALGEFDEVNMFLRGMVPLIGFPSGTVEYERNERFAGESKYPLKKMISFAFEGITSFSIKPIRLVSWLGIIISIVSLFVLIYTLCVKAFGVAVPGWTTIVASIWMLGGIQLLCLGIVGEYVGKIYSEVKKRPKYIIDQFLDATDTVTGH